MAPSCSRRRFRGGRDPGGWAAGCRGTNTSNCSERRSVEVAIQSTAGPGGPSRLHPTASSRICGLGTTVRPRHARLPKSVGSLHHWVSRSEKPAVTKRLKDMDGERAPGQDIPSRDRSGSGCRLRAAVGSRFGLSGDTRPVRGPPSPACGQAARRQRAPPPGQRGAFSSDGGMATPRTGRLTAWLAVVNTRRLGARGGGAVWTAEDGPSMVFWTGSIA